MTFAVICSLEARGFDALPHWAFEHGGWRIAFFPIPKGPENRGRGGIRPVALQFEAPRQIDPRESIRDAILAKAGRYGDLELPYVIASLMIWRLWRHFLAGNGSPSLAECRTESGTREGAPDTHG